MTSLKKYADKITKYNRDELEGACILNWAAIGKQRRRAERFRALLEKARFRIADGECEHDVPCHSLFENDVAKYCLHCQIAHALENN